MAKSTVERLTPAEKKALALFYDTDGYKALEKFCSLEVTALGVDALTAPNLEYVKYLKGRADWANELLKLIRLIYKESNKEQKT